MYGGSSQIGVEIQAIERSAHYVDEAAASFLCALAALQRATGQLRADWNRITQEATKYREALLEYNNVHIAVEPDWTQNSRFENSLEQLHSSLTSLPAITTELETVKTVAFGATQEYEVVNRGLKKLFDRHHIGLFSLVLPMADRGEQPFTRLETIGNALLSEKGYFAREFAARTVGDTYRNFGKLFSMSAYDLSPEKLRKRTIEVPEINNLSEFMSFANEQNKEDKGAIQHYTIEKDGETMHVIYVPGTVSWRPGDKEHPLGASSNVDAMFDGESTSTEYLENALAAAGLGPDDNVTIVAHSQGGIVTNAVVRKLAQEKTGPNIKNVVTAESPTANNPLPLATRSIHIENNSDMVPTLDGGVNRNDANSITITGDAVHPAVHDVEAAVDILEEAQHNPRSKEITDIVWQDMDMDGATVTATTYQVEVRKDPMDYLINTVLNPEALLERNLGYIAGRAAIDTLMPQHKN